MDYKKIIKSKSLRLKMLRLLSFIPDKQMLMLQYRIKMGRKLDLKNPKRFTEKIQWYKLHYKNPKMIQCVDKYDVREYVKAKGLERILIPCYGVYDSADQINWDALPNQFVMKDTLGGGGNSVIIVKDKTATDIGELKKRAAEWTAIKAHVRDAGREWPYYSGKNHRIIIEKYLESEELEGGLIDYKFFCFDGKPTWIYVIADRELGHNAGLSIHDSDFLRVSAKRHDERVLERIIEKSVNFDIMKRIATTLSEEFPEARIDLYNNKGEIVFGEITFYDGSGYLTYTPDSFAVKLGEEFKLHKYGGAKLIITNRKLNLKNEIEDYKFFCFNGKAQFMYIMGERVIGQSVKVAILNSDFEMLPVTREGDDIYENYHKPQNINEMRYIAEQLSEDFPHVRVDLYSTAGHIYFGELTFYNASGYMKYNPDSFDINMGKYFLLNNMDIT